MLKIILLIYPFLHREYFFFSQNSESSIEQSSFTKSSFEHKFMNNIKKIYQHADKCDDQQNIKDIIEATILSTPEGVTDNIPNVHMK